MNKLFLMLLILFPALAIGDAPSKTPQEVVNARMKAYNDHDLTAFLNTYSENVQIFTYPNKPLGTPGKEHLAFIFEPMFKEKSVNVEIHHQITQGNYVVNHETVTYGSKKQKYVSIYEVANGLITSVQFLRE
jgi:hypothetical protein